jgi:membrane-associated phospholipid phosphatase
MPHLTKLLLAAGTALAIAGCADRPTEPDGSAQSAAAASAKIRAPGPSLTWNGVARGFLETRTPWSPFFEVRVLTYLSVAQYNAIIAADDAKTRRSRPSRAGAAAGASVVVLKEFFPEQAAALEDRIAQQEADPPWPGRRDQEFAAGEAIGRSVGEAVLAYARADGFGATPAPPVPTGPGYWTSTAPVLGLHGTRPWALTSPDQFRAAAPPAFDSPALLTDLAEIRTLSDTRTEEQLAQAQFWNQRVGRYQNEIAAGLLSSHWRNERETAHILALANMAAFDAMIGCWDSKFAYWYIRPSQADPAITLPIGLPNHPSYPSGHSCVTSAYTTVLVRTFPKERVTLESNIEAAGLSRMYGGIHYRFDIEAGALLGRGAAENVLAADVKGHRPIPLD